MALLASALLSSAPLTALLPGIVPATSLVTAASLVALLSVPLLLGTRLFGPFLLVLLVEELGLLLTATSGPAPASLALSLLLPAKL